jgi:hypothetical protein
MNAEEDHTIWNYMNSVDNRTWHSHSYQQTDASIPYGNYFNYYDPNYYYTQPTHQATYAPIVYATNWDDTAAIHYPSYGPMPPTSILPIDSTRETSTSNNTFQKEPNASSSSTTTTKSWTRQQRSITQSHPASLGNRNTSPTSYSYSHDDLLNKHGNTMHFTAFPTMIPVPYITTKQNMDAMYTRRPPKSAELFDPNVSSSTNAHSTNIDAEYTHATTHHVPRSPSHESFFAPNAQYHYQRNYNARNNRPTLQSLQSSMEKLHLDDHSGETRSKKVIIFKLIISSCMQANGSYIRVYTAHKL